ADALARVVVEADRDVLAIDGQTFEVHHDRVRETGDPHRPAGVGHHAELGHPRKFAVASGGCRLDGQRAAEAEVVRLRVVVRFHGHPCRAPLLRLCPKWVLRRLRPGLVPASSRVPSHAGAIRSPSPCPGGRTPPRAWWCCWPGGSLARWLPWPGRRVRCRRRTTGAAVRRPSAGRRTRSSTWPRGPRPRRCGRAPS